ncbi:hypothetical protein M2480_001006 [Parabacteroides sp. PFB2-12]|uniref:hypothetical protein n=1 Tax=unclassified Parabacteroides TaxID=2649774 RepID=UPI002473F3BB|nr:MULTISPECIES: hypothetical protein [unclassified Parabacteroides]MDH6342384.1 hypothetical protein [Parabacteroides sp. PM6-13]MDH6390036.1 hypothetical protein [Parabacteroides sp. PFB2-12]
MGRSGTGRLTLLMRRIASHFIWYRHVYPLHYLEIDEQGCFRGVFPLREEIAGTAFFDGVLIPVPLDLIDSFHPDEWECVTENLQVGDPVQVIHITGLEAAAAKLGAYDGGSRGYIERL